MTNGELVDKLRQHPPNLELLIQDAFGVVNVTYVTEVKGEDILMVILEHEIK